MTLQVATGHPSSGPASGTWPQIIQGGMGVAISGWRLARAVSVTGHLGVVSGTGIDTVMIRRLQDGDIGGHVRRALAACPWSSVVERVLSRYFLPEGRSPGKAYARLPMWTAQASAARQAIGMLAGYVEVWLAKAGQPGKVGINLLTKVTLPNLSVLYGAMHAGVDVVLMGAGIPREIPGALDRLAIHEAAALRLEVLGQRSEDPPVLIRFDPQAYETASHPPLGRPAFFPIIAANSLATLMTRKATGSVEGFVIEGPTAGGHNAPPRGTKQFDALGQPVYGARDAVDLDAIAALGYPFWIAGGSGSPEGLAVARAQGAVGIQVGTLFAYSDESGMAADVKQQILATARTGSVAVRTDPLASPTGFPFKVVEAADTLSEESVYHTRRRVCDLGYLRDAYKDDRGVVRYRCAAEPVKDFVSKGGLAEDTEGRKCLCNGLMSTAGLPQLQTDGMLEPVIVTSGDAINDIRALMKPDRDGYSAQDVIHYLTRAVSAPVAMNTSASD